ncbi:ureidoglycolate lyase [Marinobacterium mangrovicola]|uniref:Ureidoglycolate lyase n=1 Tax=Marinobacterium mangrovicola TaxID=1476959 RepID=A0A4R1GQH0_9GAMM|nr:ureidoglycolate lyase [Marinobacterium mangrovicola]TCK09245.1 ureidoglycolate lyase [Marinobacterium mangrovicola]
MILKPMPLTAEAFAPYGDLIETGADPMIINYGNTERHHDLADLDLSEKEGKAIVSIFRSKPLPLPLSLKIMERHPLSSQAFIPMGTEPYLVVVAPAGEFDASKLQAFIARPDQGVNYARGTWHHFCLALNDVSDFVVIDRGGEGPNCDEAELPEQVDVDLSGIAEILAG